MAREDFPYCCYCGSLLRRFHVKMLQADELGSIMEFVCYDCGNSVIVSYDAIEGTEKVVPKGQLSPEL